jgi:hypothetical protein
MLTRWHGATLIPSSLPFFFSYFPLWVHRSQRGYGNTGRGHIIIIIVTVTKSYSVYIKYYSKQGEKIMVLVGDILCLPQQPRAVLGLGLVRVGVAGAAQSGTAVVVALVVVALVVVALVVAGTAGSRAADASSPAGNAAAAAGAAVSGLNVTKDPGAL